MSSINFDPWFDFCEERQNDGQPFHITPGDPGGATAYGWTYAMWKIVAPLHGITDVSLDNFKLQTTASLKPLSHAQYWNGVQADRMPNGFDIFWVDFQFGSGYATKVLEGVLGVPLYGAVNVDTLAALTVQAAGNPVALLDRFLVARIGYYDRKGFRTRWPGLYVRAQACYDLAKTIMLAPTVTPGIVTAPRGQT